MNPISSKESKAPPILGFAFSLNPLILPLIRHGCAARQKWCKLATLILEVPRGVAEGRTSANESSRSNSLDHSCQPRTSRRTSFAALASAIRRDHRRLTAVGRLAIACSGDFRIRRRAPFWPPAIAEERRGGLAAQGPAHPSATSGLPLRSRWSYSRSAPRGLSALEHNATARTTNSQFTFSISALYVERP